MTFGTKENGKPQQYKKSGFKTKQAAQRSINQLEHSLNHWKLYKAKQANLQGLYDQAVSRR
ncbi:Arm DNA-binding domain-containing protein [Paenibacillus alba]|uniref:Arm DNA-binding domain-containing protein n=1 Tax=Paenibacillus alba TaxID=1197127 RepID=UPI001FE55E1D|nr:Arm DNA-binding domain-containing protein [Paenibacillus alba]